MGVGSKGGFGFAERFIVCDRSPEVHGELLDGSSQAAHTIAIGLNQIFHSRASFAHRHMAKYSQAGASGVLSRPARNMPYSSFSGAGGSQLAGDPSLSRVSRRQRFAGKQKGGRKPNLYKNLKDAGFNPQVTPLRFLSSVFLFALAILFFFCFLGKWILRYLGGLWGYPKRKRKRWMWTTRILSIRCRIVPVKSHPMEVWRNLWSTMGRIVWTSTVERKGRSKVLCPLRCSLYRLVFVFFGTFYLFFASLPFLEFFTSSLPPCVF